MPNSLDSEAFDFIQNLEHVDSIETLNKLFMMSAKKFGIDYFACGVVLAPGKNFYPEHIFGTVEHSWVEHYRASRFFVDDPAVRRGFVSRYPFTWSEMLVEDNFTKNSLKVMQDAWDFSLKDGLVVPLHGLRGELSLFSMAGETPNLETRAKGALQLMAVHAHSKAEQLINTRKVEEPRIPLTPRQVEVLKWVCEGKTDSDISDILSISESMAHKHVEDAKARLNVPTRLQAVVKAIRNGYLDR